MEKVQILMSTYNGEKYVEDQIKSVLSQYGVKINLLVRDDGSNDNTINIIKKFSAINYLKCYQGENIKTGDSFRDLISNCSSFDYYAFCDQDDIWLNNKLYVAIEKIKEVENDKSNIPIMYFCNPNLVDENLNPIKFKKKDPNLSLTDALISNKATGCTIVFNKNLLQLLKKYYPSKRDYLHDWWIYLICLAVNGRVIYDSNSYILYRQHSKNVIGARESLIKRNKRRIMNIILDRNQIRSIIAKDLLDGFFDIINLEDKVLLENIYKYKKSMKCKINLIHEKRFYNNNLVHNIKFIFLVLLNIF